MQNIPPAEPVSERVEPKPAEEEPSTAEPTGHTPSANKVFNRCKKSTGKKRTAAEKQVTQDQFFDFQREMFDKAEDNKNDRQAKMQEFQKDLFTGLFKMLAGGSIDVPIRNSQKTDDGLVPS